MNRLEAKRYAHQVVAGLVRQHLEAAADLLGGEDGGAIRAALAALAEQHARYGPKTTDPAPRLRARWVTPLLDERPPVQGALAEEG